MTNEEKIKSMTREELAKYLLGQKQPYCAERNCPDDHNCDSCVLEWLDEEARNDEKV